jgi:hypothetical protein
MKSFKKNVKVLDENYGEGYITGIDPNYIWGLGTKELGRIKVIFDFKTVYFTMDGREFPVGTGYFFNGVFKPYMSEITLKKI